MSNLKVIPTTELLTMLKEECKEDYSSVNVYLYIRELASRQLSRQSWALHPMQKMELIDTVATNLYLFVQRNSSGKFVITNWLKYIYNTVYKTCLGMFYNGADVKPCIVELDDVVELDNFLNRYFYNQITQYYDFDKIDADDCIDSLYKYLVDCIKYYLKYNETYKYYNQVFASVLMSIILKRDVHLYGLDRKDCHYVDTISRIIMYNFENYLKDNMIIDKVGKHSDIINNLVEYMQYERLNDVYYKD